jgi:hypothetical protein
VIKGKLALRAFLRRRPVTPCQNFCEHLAAASLQPQVRIFHGGKTAD